MSKKEKEEKYHYHRGDIVYVKKLMATGGHEICGRRPAVIVSSDWLNRTSDVLIVVTLTTTNTYISTTHVPIPSQSTSSVAKCEQPKSIDRQFITYPIGHVTSKEMRKIDRGLNEALRGS